MRGCLVAGLPAAEHLRAAGSREIERSVPTCAGPARSIQIAKRFSPQPGCGTEEWEGWDDAELASDDDMMRGTLPIADNVDIRNLSSYWWNRFQVPTRWCMHLRRATIQEAIP